MGRVLVECCDPANRGVEDQSLLNIAALARSNQRVDQSGTGGGNNTTAARLERWLFLPQ
jgi:hypothetical protein